MSIVVANDISPTAYLNLTKNIEKNDLTFNPRTQTGVLSTQLPACLALRCCEVPTAQQECHLGDISAILQGQKFDIVDLDPFGSPVPFLDSAMRAVRDGGLLCIVATDVSVFTGTERAACTPRYGVVPPPAGKACGWEKELALRGVFFFSRLA